MRRFLYAVIVLVLAGGAGWWFAGERLVLMLVERALTANFSAPPFAQTLPRGLHVVLCGAGGPLPADDRSPPCLLVIAGEDMFLVDTGANSARNLGLMRISLASLDAVLLTHFHSDHIAGLGEVMLGRWVTSANLAPLPVYGAAGVEEVVAGFNTAFRQDSMYRNAHHGDSVAPLAGAGGEAVVFPNPAKGESVVVWEKDGVKITAFFVVHDPVHPAVGFRFDYAGRSLVISGDTNADAGLARIAQGADLLLHEALSPELVGLAERLARAAGNAIIAKIMADIPDYHTSPIEAARIAQEAGVAQLVYYHIVPPLPLRTLEGIFLRGTDEVFSGDIVLGHDGMIFSLPANGTDIIRDELL